MINPSCSGGRSAARRSSRTLTRGQNRWPPGGCFPTGGARWLLCPQGLGLRTPRQEVTRYTHVFRSIICAESHLRHFHLEVISSLNSAWGAAVSRVRWRSSILNRFFSHTHARERTHTHTPEVLRFAHKYRAGRSGKSPRKYSSRYGNPPYFHGTASSCRCS